MKFIASCGLIAMAMFGLTAAKFQNRGNSLRENQDWKAKKSYEDYKNQKAADKK